MYVCMYVCKGEGGESPKKCFRPGPKIRGGPGPSPGSATAQSFQY